MRDIEPITLQSLSKKMGEELAIRSCAPVAFYMLLKANGYLPGELEPDRYMVEMDRAALTTGNGDWSRPALTEYLRQKYRAKIVSWWLNGHFEIELMKKSGYLKSDEEVQFLSSQVVGKQLRDIVEAGYPVIVTMKPGFGNTHSKDVHAVILLEWSDNMVTVVDPDARNKQTGFNPDYVLGYLQPNGAGSVVLPK